MVLAGRLLCCQQADCCGVSRPTVVLSGELRDNEWQPARAPIDFLQLMEDEQHRTPPVVDEDAVMEKEGLGTSAFQC